MSVRSGEIRALTGLRGAAACWVMVYHTAYRAPTGTPIGRLIHHGYLAVDLFFILSGYVLALNYGDWFAGTPGRGTYAGFLQKRLARIYPLYAAATLLTALLDSRGYLAGMRAEPGSILPDLLMVQSWHTGFASIDSPSWSISCEWLAYLLFPLVCRAILFARPASAWTIVAVAAVAIAALARLPAAWIDEQQLRVGPLDVWVGSSFGPVIRCLAEFGIGVALCRAARHALGLRLQSAGPLSVGVAGAILVLLCLPGTDLAVVALFAALVFSLAGDRGPAARVAGWAPVYLLGVISYSIYLVHVPMLAALQEWYARSTLLPHGVIRAIVAWGAVLAVSTLSYLAIERPARRGIGRLKRPAILASRA